MTLLIVGLAAIRLFELSDFWHLVASGVLAVAIAGLGLAAISRIRGTAPRTEQPPRPVRLTAAITVIASLAARALWGFWPFIVIASVGLVIVLVIGNSLDPHPASLGVLIGKIALLFASVAAVIGATLLLINHVEPLWLGLTLALALLVASVILSKKLARWEAARAESRATE